MKEDKQTRARITEHLNNEFDQITDEDILNAKTEELVVPDHEVVDPDLESEIEGLVGEETAEDSAGPVPEESERLRDNDDPEIDNDTWNLLEP
jgi:hypothetical protein